MTTMLERAARAVIEAEQDQWDLPAAEWDMKALEVHGALSIARAVLMAIRDGSPEIFSTMESALPLWPSSHCDNRKELAQSANQPRVRAMIDAILNETPE